MIKRVMICIIMIVLIVGFLSAEIKIVSKQNITVIDYDENALSKIAYIEPPVRIEEGYNGELIVLKDTFFEVFDKTGKRIKRVGNRGQGPGDFISIGSMLKYKNRYYFLDFPGKISVFDKNFNFKKRFYLGGAKISTFLYSFDICNDKIYANQFYLKRKTKTQRFFDTIIEYDMSGKIINHFLDEKELNKIFPVLFLISGKIKIINGKILFSMVSYPKFWVFSKKGKLLKEKEFDFKWWVKTVYNEKKYERDKIKMGDGALAKAIFTGTYIYAFDRYKGKLVVHVIRTPYEDPQHGFVMFDENLKILKNWTQIKGYQYSGAGKKYLYFSKTVRYIEDKNLKEVEILKCEVK